MNNDLLFITKTWSIVDIWTTDGFAKGKGLIKKCGKIEIALEIIGKHTPFLKHLAFIGKQTAANGL